MPREVIRDEASLYDIQVGWSPDRWVQVGIRTRDERPIVENLGYGGGETDGNKEAEPATFNALWGTLNRESINQMIRVLRRARNAVYGGDE